MSQAFERLKQVMENAMYDYWEQEPETSNLEMVKEFHESFGVPVNSTWESDLLDLRWRLITEEYDEVGQAFDEYEYEGKTPKAKMHVAKELADLLYVIYGTAVSLGIPLNEVFRRVHLSNMSKLGPDGKPVYREDGKVLKGPNYREANLEDLV